MEDEAPMPNLSKTRVAVYAATEAVVPGASNLLEKNYKNGFIHLVAGIAASAIYGPAGMLLVAANSLHKSVTGDQLYERLGVFQPAPAAVVEAVPAPVAVVEPPPPPHPLSDPPVAAPPPGSPPRGRNRPAPS
jgi:hypothetical protein